MFEKGQIVLVTRDWEGNNTKGKLGKIVDGWGSDYKIGLFEKTEKTNMSIELCQVTYGDEIKSTWWVREYVLKKAMTKNKFK